MADDKRAAVTADSAQVLGLQGRIDRLEERLDILTHANRALWKLVSEKLNLSEEDLKQRILALKAEQEITRNNPKPAPPCPKCGRPLVKGRTTCVYCGELHNAGDIFDGVL